MKKTKRGVGVSFVAMGALILSVLAPMAAFAEGEEQEPAEEETTEETLDEEDEEVQPAELGATSGNSVNVTCQGDNEAVTVKDGNTEVGELKWDEPSTGKVTFEAFEGFEGYTVELCINGGTDVLDPVVLGDGESNETATTNNGGQSAEISNVKNGLSD